MVVTPPPCLPCPMFRESLSEPETATRSRECRRVSLVVREMSSFIDDRLEDNTQNTVQMVSELSALMEFRVRDISDKLNMVLGMLNAGYSQAAQWSTSNDMLHPPVLAWCSMKSGDLQQMPQQQPEAELSQRKIRCPAPTRSTQVE